MATHETLYRIRATVYPSGAGTTEAEEMLEGKSIGSGDTFHSVDDLERKMAAARVEHGVAVRNVHFISGQEGVHELIYEFSATEEQMTRLGFYRIGERCE